MVSQEHKVARSQLGADTPRGRGQDQGRDPQLLDDPNRERHRFEIVPLVIMKPTLKYDGRHSSERAQEHLPFMPGDGRSRKVGDPVVWHDRRRDETVSELVQSRTEHNRHARGLIARGTEHGGGLYSSSVQVRRRRARLGIHKRIPAIHAER